MPYTGPATGTDRLRIIKLVAAVLISSFVGIKFHPELARNQAALNTIVTIFSVLGGFFVATMMLIVDPVLRRAKLWRQLEMMEDTVRRRLLHCKVLFLLYLTTLSLAFILLIAPTDCAALPFLHGLFLSFTTFILLVSFTLPGVLNRSQMARYKADLDKVTPKVLKDLESDKKNKK